MKNEMQILEKNNNAEYNKRFFNICTAFTKLRVMSKHSCSLVFKQHTFIIKKPCNFIFLFAELMNSSEIGSGSLDMSSYDGSQSPRSGGAMTPNSRNKRMRTSFKHNQLRTMKSYFAINQNPDAKDLKQLAQKTGLSKRVLQVWFQNARAKYRRNIMRHDGTMQTGCPPITSYTSTEIHTPNSSESDMTPSHSHHALEEMQHMTFAELY